jgi:2-amino-4-hydroxy-6-hydroxymethyldihydropteridine diphosphokinase
MNTAYLLIGGNQGNRMHYLHRATEAITVHCGHVARLSGIYETEAWGIRDQDSFLNRALEVHTQLSAFDLLACVLRIEERLGREREVKYGPRTIDIDILLFNSEVIRTENLVVPHPHMQHRRFALQCLHDIAPHIVHPVFQKPITQLLQECSDPLKVTKVQ